MHQYGNFVRLLMYNCNKNITTKKQDVKALYSLDNKDMLSLIEYTKGNIKKLGLELVGIEKNHVVDPMISDKYYLRRYKEIQDADEEDDIQYKCNTQGDNDIYFSSPTLKDTKLIIIYTLILLEGNKISLHKLVCLCEKINLFKDDDIENYLRYLKKDNYISIEKVDQEYEVLLGYKYYVEYGDIDITDMM